MSSSSSNKSVADLELAYYTEYPSDLSDITKDIFTKLSSIDVPLERVIEYLEAFKQHQAAQAIAESAQRVLEGSERFERLSELVATNSEVSSVEHEDRFVTDNLEELYEHTYKEQGLRWRLKTLNKSLGSLRRGDFGFLFARPETGKTTFLASEVTFMASQSEGPILWFNNEEQGSKVKIRCYQAALGLPLQELFRDRGKSAKTYKDLVGDKIRIFDSASIYRKEVERLCKELSPSLIVFDQIDKIKGFSEDRNDLELGAIYIWARELAKEFCPVIGVCQAGGTGEGKKYLSMDDVVNAKTSKQAEADWILGIGVEHSAGMEYVRGMHLCKNKLQGDPDSDEELRHAKLDCMIDPVVARYKDIMIFS